MSRTFTIIHYYVPEDLDDQETLNGFTIPKPQDEITLKDIKVNFPLPGQYIFRFKYMYEKKQYIWMDISSNSTVVPTLNSKIIMKASRISWENKDQEKVQPKKPVSQQQSQQQRKPQEQSYHKSSSIHSQGPSQTSQQSQNIKKDITQVHHVHSDDLLDFNSHGHQNQTGHSANSHHQGGSNHSLNNNIQQHSNGQNGNQFKKQQPQQQQQGNQNDLMSFDDFMPSNNNQNSQKNNNNASHGNDLLDL